MTLDIFIVVILLVGTYLGWKAGFLRQIVHLVAVILTVGLSIFLQEIIYGWLSGKLGSSVWFGFVVYVFIFLGVYIGLFFLTLLLEKPLKEIQPNLVNRMAGSVIGLLKVALICGGVLLLFVRYPVAEFNSRLTPHVLNYTKSVVFIMPQKYKNLINDFINQAAQPQGQSPEKNERK